MPVFLTTVVSPEETVDAVQSLMTKLKAMDLEQILSIVILFAACLVVMRIILKVMDHTFHRLDVDKGLRVFIRSAVHILLWLITAIIVLSYLGIPMTSLIAVLSVVGLAVSLAIQGTLSNLAGGIMVLTSKPFKADDYIEAGSVSGVVVEVGLVYTKMKTFDNKIIFIPNGKIAGETLVNYTDQQARRVDLTFSASYDDPTDKVCRVIREVINAHPKAQFTPEPFVRVSAYGDSSIQYTVRVWCATEDYWDLYYDLLDQVKTAFDQNGIEMTYNHLNVHMVERTVSKE